MNNSFTLDSEITKLVEIKIRTTLEGIDSTLRKIMEKQKVELADLKKTMHSLEESFSLFSQKWSLQILFILYLRNSVGFNSLKEILEVNSHTLSNKLKSLSRHKYVERKVKKGPPLRVIYSLTYRGRNIILLSLPLIYYSRTNMSKTN